MPTGEHSFEKIAIDLVGELSESKGFNPIVDITDRLTKI